ncbi:hypothetical protein KR009_000629, partial [Drosophila setifemur]
DSDMGQYSEDWSDWNPIAQDFNDERKTEFIDEEGKNQFNEGPAPAREEWQIRSAKQAKFPYLVVQKDTPWVTEAMLINLFSTDLIVDLEFRQNSRVYFVYFRNVCCLEAGLMKVECYPNLIQCFTGRHTQRPPESSTPVEKHKNPIQDPGPPCKLTEQTGINLDTRTLSVSESRNQHPAFIRAPLVSKAEYSTKGSLLALNDANKRFLSVKYEFALERYGAYVLKDELNKGVVRHFRSGRCIYVRKECSPKPDVNSLHNVGMVKCLACDNFTDNICKLCKMPFCNALCFKVIAVLHLEFCGSGKILEPKMKVERKYPRTGLPPSCGLVKITAFEQTNVVYVRSAELRADVAYIGVLREVSVLGKKAIKLQKMPECGQKVLHKSNTEMARAMVLNVDDPKDIYVVAIDYGSVEITSLENLYECSEYLAHLPCYPVAVQLRGVPRRFMSPIIRELIYEIGDSLIFKIKYSKRDFDSRKDMQIVVLNDEEKNRNLNRLFKTLMTPIEPSIHQRGFTEDVSSSIFYDFIINQNIFVQFLNHIYLPPGKNIELVVMDNSFLKFGLIYCTLRDLAYEITKMQRDIQAYGDTIAKCESYAAPKNELCIAKYQGKWCRGISMELVGDGYPSILFIDYGNIVPIHVTDIRQYPPQFKFPVMTTELEVMGLPEEISDEQVKRLEQHFAVGNMMKCDEIVGNEKANQYSVRFNELNAILNLN